jgi:uncharacterized protein YbbK (DUF523 family)
MRKVLIGACLVGQPVRYDGKDAKVDSEIVSRWLAEGRLVAVCPELAGGMGVPRPPGEIVGIDGAAVLDGAGRVMESSGRDVTDPYVSGARSTLELARAHDIQVAVLKDGSPTCGTSYIYDGTFRHVRKYGAMGVAAALLRRHGIAVFSQDQIALADRALREAGG